MKLRFNLNRLEQNTLLDFRLSALRMTTLSPTKSAVICHCLQITEAQVRESIESGRISNVKDMMDCTGAGSGCTACHRQILAMLRQKCRQQSAYSPPTCVER